MDDGDFNYMTEEEQIALAMRESLASSSQGNHAEMTPEPDHYDYRHDQGITEDEDLPRALQASMKDVGKYQSTQNIILSILLMLVCLPYNALYGAYSRKWNNFSPPITFQEV